MLFDYGTLRVIWWALLGVLLVGFAIMDGLDLGVAILHPFVARNDAQRRVTLNVIGPVWEGNQIWFVLGGGAVFAAWPLLYAASFSGFYLAMMLVLTGFILRPVALTFRSKLESRRWRSAWDYVFFFTGLAPTFVFGVAFGNLLRGAPFHFDKSLQFVYEGDFFGLLNPFALLCGAISVAMIALQGAAFLVSKSEGEIAARARRCGANAAVAVIVLFSIAGLWVALGVDGYVVQSVIDAAGPSNPLLKSVTQERGAWFANYRLMPVSALAPVLAYVGAVVAIFALRFEHKIGAIVGSGGAIIGVITTAGFSLFPFLLPSSTHPGHSLTVWDASSSRPTLLLMLVVVLVFLPIVLGYTAFAYRVFRGVVTEEQVTRGDDYAY
jgi:cytochrome bd ubiquinol oxidase subunit II